MSTVHSLEAVLPGMIARRGGCIAVVASMAGYRGLPTSAAEARGLEAAVTAYVTFYEGLTPDSLERLEVLHAPDVGFRDYFNDVTGVAAYRAILARMFEDLAASRFTVMDRAISGGVAYLGWDLSFLPHRGGAAWRIEGMSEVHFDAEGRVSAHLDHWEPGRQFYGRLPLLRQVIAFIRKRPAVRP